MRHTVRALVGLVLVGCCSCPATAAESGRRFWPFGREAGVSTPPAAPSASGVMAPPPAQQQQPVTPQASSAEPERRWMIESPLAKISWPRVHLPELPRPQMPQLWPKKSEVDDARNAWVDKTPNPNRLSPLQAVTDGARRVGDSTRAAWDKTVDTFTPGPTRSSSSRIARSDVRPPFWKRMFSADKTQKERPQTMPQWMAQERLDP
jgi:hypothetical protein